MTSCSRIVIVTSLAALVIAAISTSALADPVTDCAAIEGKAFVALFNALFKEGGRACSKGSLAHPGPVSFAAAGSAAGKFYAAIGKALDKDGRSSCFVTLDNLGDVSINAEPEDLLNAMERVADQLCLVP